MLVFLFYEKRAHRDDALSLFLGNICVTSRKSTFQNFFLSISLNFRISSIVKS